MPTAATSCKVLCMYEVKEIDGYNPINNYIIATKRGYGGYALSTRTKFLLVRICALSTKVLEVVVCMLEEVACYGC